MPVITSGPGYNGVTGAKATFNADEQMWVDTNGQRIRPDAIVPGEAPAASAPAGGGASPAPAPAAAGLPASSAIPSAAPMQALAGAAQGFQELNSASALNPALGTRLNPKSLQSLSAMAGRNY